MGCDMSRTRVVETAINEYLDARGVPRDVPSAGREKSPPDLRSHDDGVFFSGAGHSF
jgi:hypothetical protein